MPPIETRADDGRSGAKTICFDLDGTLCTNTFGDYEAAVPFPWAIARVNELADDGHHILIMTARGSATGIDWGPVTRGQLERWGVRYESLHFGKPSADVYVDDRAVHTDSWRISDVTRPPGFARPRVGSAEQFPATPPPDRSSVVEVARTFGGRLHGIEQHIERSLRLAAAAGIRFRPAADVVADAVDGAVSAAASDEDDLIVTIAHADETHASLVDTWEPHSAGGLHVACRRLREAAAGVQRFLTGSADGAIAVAAAQAGDERCWPLADDPGSGVTDVLGGQLALVRGGDLLLAPAPSLPTIAGTTLRALAVEHGLAVREEPLTAADLAEANEAMIVAMPFCIVPIGSLEERSLPGADPAGTTALLLGAWSERVGVDLAAQAAELVRRHTDATAALGA